MVPAVKEERVTESTSIIAEQAVKFFSEWRSNKLITGILIKKNRAKSQVNKTKNECRVTQTLQLKGL